MNICRPQMLQLVNNAEQNKKMVEHFSPAYACWRWGESPLALLTNQQILQHGSPWLQPDSRSVVSGSQRQQRPLMRRHIGDLGLPQGDDEHGSSWVYRHLKVMRLQNNFRNLQKVHAENATTMLQFGSVDFQQIVWFQVQNFTVQNGRPLLQIMITRSGRAWNIQSEFRSGNRFKMLLWSCTRCTCL